VPLRSHRVLRGQPKPPKPKIQNGAAFGRRSHFHSIAIPNDLAVNGMAKREEARMLPAYNIPDTAMASAFLNALVRLVSAHHSKTKVILPTGIVDVDEVQLVPRAL
jgi:hypothetical protein